MILHDFFYVYIQTISLVDIDASYKIRNLDLKNISELNIAETKRLLQFLMQVIKEYLCLRNMLQSWEHQNKQTFHLHCKI